MDLDLKRVIQSKPRKHELEPLAPIASPFGDRVDPGHVLEEHPRPLMRRRMWQTINGWWEYAVVVDSDAAHTWRTAEAPEFMQGRILVPFSPEAPLSGVRHTLGPDELLWYRRQVDVPALRLDERLILHFEAVDWGCRVLVDGTEVAVHEGGYDPIDIDITHALSGAARALVELCVFDPTEAGAHVRGKQRLERGNIWYSAQSGIWQPAWLEVVPAARIERLQLVPDPDSGRLVARAEVAGPPAGAISVTLLDQGVAVASGSCMPGRSGKATMTLAVSLPHLWSCDDPYLYDVEARYGTDVVSSYCAFRTCTVEPDEQGVPRFCLNHEPLLLKGVLDQGYWPESLMTAPSDEALAFDIEKARDLGFNMIRKHAKVESERWYWHADRLGMLVWQDMPFGGDAYDMRLVNQLPALSRRIWSSYGDEGEGHLSHLGSRSSAFRQEWKACAEAAIRRLSGHPSIVTWVLFNEGWGQFFSREICEWARGLDPTRPIDAASGWFDQGAGDYQSIHNYFRSLRVYPDERGLRAGARRAFVLSEFGGLTLHVDGHSSCSEAYGYQAFPTAAAWRGAVRGILAQAEGLWDQGLAGFVYSQLTDIEEESNGLITYDRRVDKTRMAADGADSGSIVP